MLCVHPSLPVTSIRELVAFAEARPGQVQYGSAGNGSGAHLFTELFGSITGIKLQNIPYKGAAQATADLVRPVRTHRNAAGSDRTVERRG
jgi:tripartite-type tricarboxylate transporter receptor subunit TctC